MQLCEVISGFLQATLARKPRIGYPCPLTTGWIRFCKHFPAAKALGGGAPPRGDSIQSDASLADACRVGQIKILFKIRDNPP